MSPLRSKAYAEGKEFLFRRHVPLDIEIFVKRHVLLVRRENQYSPAEAQRCGSDHKNAFFSGSIEQEAAHFKIEKIKSIQNHINAIEEIIYIIG